MSSEPCQKGVPQTDVRPILVLGVGNILLRDEGIGVRVVEAMGQRALPPEVELFDGGTAGIDLLNVLAERQKIIIIDAIDMDDAPGTVVRLAGDELPTATGTSTSLHEIGLLETLHVARMLRVDADELVVIGVVPERVEVGLELSPRIAALVPSIIEAVEAEIESVQGRCA